jgi:hypothetical protein
MALADVGALAADTVFQNRVKAGVVKLAVTVGFNQDVNDEKTRMAVAILRDPAVYATAVAYAVAADKDGDAATVDTDAELMSAVTRVLLAMSRQ